MKNTKLQLLFLLLGIGQNSPFNEEPMLLHEKKHEISIKFQNQLFTLQKILGDLQSQIDHYLNNQEINLIENTKNNTPYASSIWSKQSIQFNFAIHFSQIRFVLSEIIEKNFESNISSLYLMEIIIIFVGLLSRNDLMQNCLSAENYKKFQSFTVQIHNVLDRKDPVTKEKMQEILNEMEKIIKLVTPHLEVIYPDVPSDVKDFTFMLNKDILQFSLNMMLILLNTQKNIMLAYLFLSIEDDTFSKIRKQSLGDADTKDTNTKDTNTKDTNTKDTNTKDTKSEPVTDKNTKPSKKK